MAQYKYLDYAGLKAFAKLISDKFTDLEGKISAGTDVKVDWDNVTGKPTTFTPSSHTQSYTTLTGSGTTKNQAIVSSGTANGWELKTLGSNAFNSTTIPTTYAGSSSAGGAATSANKLNTNAGSKTSPVYFANGVPVECDDMATQSELNTVKNDLTTAINGKLDAAKAMVYKGTVGTGGTVTSLPATHKVGDTYKVITAGTYAGETCTVGDMIICNTDGTTANNAHWDVIQDNVDLVGAQNTIGLVKNGSNVTSASGYTAIPIIDGVPYYKNTTYSADGTWLTLSTSGQFTIASAKQTAITNGATAYGWGNHASAGYASATSVSDLTTVVGGKVDKVTGKGLSTNDFTTTFKNKLDGIASGAEVNVQSDWSVTDTNSDAFIKNKPTIPTNTNQLTNGAGFITSSAVTSTIEALDSSVAAGVKTDTDGTDASVAMLTSIVQKKGELTTGTSITFTKIANTDITWEKLLA